MHERFLGDEKDCFKWDYHNYLTAQLGCGVLNLALMMSDDNDFDDKEVNPRIFSRADCRIVDFCIRLRKNRDINLLRELPMVMGESYRVELTRDCVPLPICEKQVIFFDPDTGFALSKMGKEYIDFNSVRSALHNMSEESVVSVYQHFRCIKFGVDYCEIKKRLLAGLSADYDSTAILWNGKVMFVILAKSESRLDKVRRINRQYRKCKGGVVELLDDDSA